MKNKTLLKDNYCCEEKNRAEWLPFFLFFFWKEDNFTAASYSPLDGNRGQLKLWRKCPVYTVYSALSGQNDYRL